MSTCSICDELQGHSNSFKQIKYAQVVRRKQNILFSTKNFSVIPSIGAINESHVLIVPHRHLLSLASTDLQYREELNIIKKTLQSYNNEQSGKSLLFFEHGTGIKHDTSGACVEHAHLHGIFEVEIFQPTILNEVKMVPLSNTKELQDMADIQNGYIYFENSKKHCWLANNPEVPSQYFRFLYSKVSDLKIEWNWKINHSFKLVANVISYYNQLK